MYELLFQDFLTFSLRIISFITRDDEKLHRLMGDLDNTSTLTGDRCSELSNRLYSKHGAMMIQKFAGTKVNHH